MPTEIDASFNYSQLKDSSQRRHIALICVALVCFFTANSARAHFCGPQRITLKVGEACLWRITADRTEVDSLYVPVIEGDLGAAEILPKTRFNSRHGDFIITGLQPGTNRLDVAWSYAPTMAAGFCDVTIVVVPADGERTFQSPFLDGTLATADPFGGIDSETLRKLLDQNIPAEAAKLLVLTECYGGSMAFSSQLRSAPNTTVLSATSPNQTSRYGGYHDDAARALKPGAGRTARDVHETASLGKATVYAPPHGTVFGKSYDHENSEWPRVAGGLSAAEFSLAPVSAASAVRSRHVVVFMGIPETHTSYVQSLDGISQPSPWGSETTVADNADRDAIKQNFAGEPNTTVRTAGGPAAGTNPNAGENGWDYPGNLAGLERAIKEAGEAIRNSLNPAAEQFILFVGDHGGQANLFLSTFIPTVNPGTTINLGKNTVPLSAGDGLGVSLKLDLQNTPTWSIKLQYADSNTPAPQSSLPPALPAAGDFALNFQSASGLDVTLTNFAMQVLDLDHNGVIDSKRGETVELFFPIDEDLLLRRFADAAIDINLRNASRQAFQVTALKLNSGAIRKPFAPVPAPVFLATRALPAGQVEFTIQGPFGQQFLLEHSSDLKNWTSRRTIRFGEAVVTAIDTLPAGSKNFYRLRWLQL